MSLKEMRQSLDLRQKEASEMVGMPLRTFVNYENDPEKKDSTKYRYIKERVEEHGRIDETHGLLTIGKIKEISSSVFSDYPVEYAYLFGSSATGKQTPSSDISARIHKRDRYGIFWYG